MTSFHSERTLTGCDTPNDLYVSVKVASMWRSDDLTDDSGNQ